MLTFNFRIRQGLERFHRVIQEPMSARLHDKIVMRVHPIHDRHQRRFKFGNAIPHSVPIVGRDRGERSLHSNHDPTTTITNTARPMPSRTVKSWMSSGWSLNILNSPDHDPWLRISLALVKPTEPVANPPALIFF